MADPNGSTARRGLREMLSGIGSVGCALVGGLIGLVLAFAWLIAVDVVTRGVVSWFEDVVGERGLILVMGAALALIGAVFLALILRNGRRPEQGLGQWLLGLAFSAGCLVGGVALLIATLSGGSTSAGF